MGAYKYLEELYKRKQCDTLRFLLRIRAWHLRQLSSVHRASRPTRPDKARRMGYKVCTEILLVPRVHIVLSGSSMVESKGRGGGRETLVAAMPQARRMQCPRHAVGLTTQRSNGRVVVSLPSYSCWCGVPQLRACSCHGALAA